MTDVKATGAQIEQFPYDRNQLRLAHPKISFPRVIPDELAAAYDVHPVAEADRPADQAGKVVEQNSLPDLIDGAWVLGWAVRDMTAEELAAEQAVAMAAGKAECRRRILAVADETAQINLAAAAGANLLTDEQRAVFTAGVQWIGQMRAAWPALVASGVDLADDANWPTAPAGAAELADEF
ncbi:hypothetical protein PXK58_00935 [Phaeobacter gallaeciensis]|uniref:hypothetical protein n=1 Tax=Phaeobacter gallaeciensis TaxID=60890 RepID=UPI002380805F|nr:hypothetical protein [Phaeobacter gallaeciensis]MDE4272949.1 hypothetical protein [Phaeobacter gallaeciensis]MDE4298098.1 hypothetical protein [Phaeobacter gallaeciensis]MDE5183286.1 hypothetical protein [Phaeobacter gallaeciensis]